MPERLPAIVIADPVPLTLEGLALFMERHPAIRVVDRVRNGRDLVQSVRTFAPSVVVVGASLPDLDVGEVLRAAPAAAQFVCLADDTVPDAFAAIAQSGRLHVVSRLASPTLMVERIAALATEPDASRSPAFGDDRFGPTRRSHDQLTPREVAIVKLVIAGLTNREIASQAGISAGTVKIHLSNILRKTGMKNRTTLVSLALTRELRQVPGARAKS